MTARTYYAGPVEAPVQVDAVQYPTEAESLHWKASQWDSRETDLLDLIRGREVFADFDLSALYQFQPARIMRPGQWLVRFPDGRVKIRDTEPVWVEAWTYANSTGAWDSREFDQQAWGGAETRKAHLSNGVILPPTPVNGATP